MKDLPLAEMAAVALAMGLAVGTALDRMPARTVTTRGGYRVLEADFHAHTRFSDGFLSPFDLVLQARRRGLDALAITEHNMIFPGKIARWFAKATGGPAILVGEEVTTFRYHVHGIGLERPIRAGEPLAQVIADVHAQGGVVIAAHPVKPSWPAFDAVLGDLDGAEVMHPLAYGSGRGAWRWEDIEAFYARSLASGKRLTAVGSSDYHFGSPLGVCRTLVFAKGDDADAVLDALREGRTVVYGLDGKAYGDPALIGLLASEPYELRPQDYGYRGSGPLDRGARLLGWAGLLGLVLVRKRRAPG